MRSPFEAGLRYLIQPARAADLAVCHSLLPRATGSQLPIHLVCARDTLSRELVAALAITKEKLDSPLVGPRVAVSVLEPVRRRGIGRALIEYAAQFAARPSVRALHAWELVPLDGTEATAWSWLGFEVGETMLQHEIELAAAMEKLRPIYEELLAHDYIPCNARVVPLDPSHTREIALLNAAYLGSSSQRVRADLRKYDPAVSVVLLLGDRVMGYSIGNRIGRGVCMWDANVLHPSVRGGWANLMLKYQAGLHAAKAGVSILRYSTLARHTDSRKLNRQLGGRLVGQLLRIHRPI